MAIPTVVNVGTVGQGAGAVSPGMPASIATGDILLLFMVGVAGVDATVAGGSETWTQVNGSPVQAPTDPIVRLTVWWAVASGAGATSPTTNDTGEFNLARIVAFRGARRTAPHITQASTEDTSDTSGSATGVTTTLADCLIVVASGGSSLLPGTSTTEYSAWTNAALSSVTERVDNTWDAPTNDPMLGVATGGKAAAGATGATTFTQAHSSQKAMLTIALAGGQPVTGAAAITATGRVLSIGRTAVAPAPTHERHPKTTLSAELRFEQAVAGYAASVLSSGPRSSSTVVDDASYGTYAWSNPTNAEALDGTAAQYTSESGQSTSHYLKATNYGFTVPDSTVTGVKVDVRRRRQQVFYPKDSRVSLVVGDVVQSQNKASDSYWESEWTTASYGGPGDTWGVSNLTYTQVNAVDFGVVFSAAGGGIDGYQAVDWIGITVYYTIEGTEVAITTQPPLRFGPEESNAGRVLMSTGWSTEMPGGFSAGNLEVAAGQQFVPSDYLMASSVIREYETGRVLHEGRVTGVSDDGEKISFELEGWAKHLEDDKTARQIFYDRDFANWGGSSVTWKIADITAGKNPTDASATTDEETGAPALETACDASWDAGALPDAVGVYSGEGISLAYLDYAWKKSTTVDATDTGWHWVASLGTDADFPASDDTAELRAAGPGSGTLAATTDRKVARVRFYSTVASEFIIGVADGMHFSVFWTLLGVVGDHGITLRGTLSAPNTGRGVWASDVADYVIDTFAPLLSFGPEGLESTEDFIIPHLSFRDRTTALEMLEGLVLYGNELEPLDWWVEENKVFRFASPANHGTTWRTRRTDGTDAKAGADSGDLLNGVLVVYDDGSGTRRTVGPPNSGADSENALLVDLSDDNPANRDGAQHWEVYDAKITSAAGALIIGQAVLADRRAGWRDWRGDITLKDYVRDSSGAWTPVSLVRAGDYVVIEDDPDGDVRPRRIVQTNYNNSSKEIACSIGAPPDRMDSLLARLGVVLIGRLP